MYQPVWIKNPGQGCRVEPHPYPLPVSINPYIRFYLDVVRPKLLVKGPDTNSFWINKKGWGFSCDTTREYIKELVEEIAEKKLNIRLLRLNINSHFFESGPHDPVLQLWWNYMMDHTAETEAQYYRIWEKEKWGHQATTQPHPFMVLFFLIKNYNHSIFY